MKAARFYDIGDIRYEEIETPRTGAGEILMRVKVCGLCGTDVSKMREKTVNTPAVLGHEVAGDIAEVGEGVERFKVGERIIVTHHLPCFECHYCQHESYTQCETYKIRYSLFPGGKRFRPILVIASAETVGAKPQLALPTACALELIHSYSLIHDDLPAIDNDDYRRGRPSTHCKFGDAIAILTGDALLTQSFSLITRNAQKNGVSSDSVARIIREVTDAIGSSGMIAGQVVDIRKKKKYTRKEIEYIHSHKTGSLIKVSVRVGAILAGAKAAQLRDLTEYGKNIGLAFQIVDDALDVSNENYMANYVACFGKGSSLRKLRDLIQKAKQRLVPFGEKGKILQQIADSLASRFK